MKKFLVLFLLCSSAFAQEGVRHATYDLGTLLDAVALNGAAATRTFTVGPTLSNRINLVGFSTIGFDVNYTYSAGGVLTFTCTGTSGSGAAATYAVNTLTTCTTSAGTCTLNWAGVVNTPTLAADKKFNFPLGVSSLQSVKCAVSLSGSPAAGDIVTVKGTAIADSGTR